MQIGDLVRLPPTVIANSALGECVGVILKMHAKKKVPMVTVGTHRGVEMWNALHLHLLARNK